MDAIRSAHNWIKSNKIISTVGNALAPVLPVAGTIGKFAGTMGYGRRRRVGRPRVRRAVVVLPSGVPIGVRRRVVRRRVVRLRPLVRRRRVIVGGSLRGVLSNLHSFVKKNQLISKGLNHYGHSKLASAASSLGYGRRRRRVRRYRGGANYFTTEQIAAPKF